MFGRPAAVNDKPPLAELVEGFLARLHAAGRAQDPQLIETHISLVLLAGEFAYKFKKPVDFGFIDFSTLARRQYFCAREVALNRRFAPHIYLDVENVEVAGSRECAVRMRRFPLHATLDALLTRAAVDTDTLCAFARHLAGLHACAPPAEATVPFGSAALVRAQIDACLEAPLAPLLPPHVHTLLSQRLDQAMPRFAARRAAGFVRDCHGDLHSANVVAYEGELQAFDCIEFNDELRIIDTLSDAAFLLMDLDQHDAPTLGHVFLNSYLETRDDYQGLALLPLYCAYRALVRAKVAMLRAAQHGASALAERARADRHIALAERYLQPTGRPGLVLTHGLSGSGKSHHARCLAAQTGFIHLRSDIERRRLAGLALDARSDSATDSGIYTAQMTRATYIRLQSLSQAALAAGYSVVVDASFLDAAERAPFAALARNHGLGFHILACDASVDELRRRIVARASRGDDASEATLEVLEQQRRQAVPLTAGEREVTIPADSLAGDAASLAALGRPRPH